MQPYFFPYIGYFQLIHAVDRFFLYDHLDYSRGGWVSRNRILETGRGPSWISVPIVAPRHTQTIRDTKLNEATDWRRRLLRTLAQNYRRAPFLDETLALVERVLGTDTDSLAELNARSIVEVCDLVGIATEVDSDSTPFDQMEEVLRDEATDYRSHYPWLRLDPPVRKVVRALVLCRSLGADVFVNAIGGRALYDKAVFADHGVDLYFVQKRPIEYPQLDRAFVPDLSIIDVLMNCGPGRTAELVAEYDLV